MRNKALLALLSALAAPAASLGMAALLALAAPVAAHAQAIQVATTAAAAYTASSWETGMATTNAPAPGTNNALEVWAREIPLPLALSHIAFDVITADATNLYSVGIYGPAAACAATCPLVAHTAPASYAATGIKDVATVEPAQTLVPGVYFLALTGNASTLTWAVIGPNLTVLPALFYSANAATTAGGVLPTTLATPALAVTTTLPAVRLPYLLLSIY